MSEKKYLYLASIFLVGAFLFSLLNFNKVESAYISTVVPNEVNNADETDIVINGAEFKPYSEIYLGNFKLENVTVHTYNKITATVPKGLDAGIYDLRIVLKDNPTAIIPNSVKVTGTSMTPRVLGVKREQIVGGIKYVVKMNVPFTAKLLAGEDSNSMKVVVSKQELSKSHILPYQLPTNTMYYVTQISVTPEGGKEMKLDIEDVKMTRDGVKIQTPEFSVAEPILNFFPDTQKMEINMSATWPINLEVSKSFFSDSAFQIVQGFGSTYSTEQKVTVRELDPETMYYFNIKGKTELTNGEQEKFEKNYQVFFTKTAFLDEEVSSVEEGTGAEISSGVSSDSGVISGSGVEASTNTSAVDPFYKDFTADINWGVYYVDALKKQGIVKGNKEGSFDPKRLLTRAELAMMIARVSKYELPENPPAYFTDVAKTHDAFKALGYMVPKKIIKGFGDGTFRPDEPVNRGDVLIMIINALGLKIDDKLKTSHFLDVKTDDIHLPYIELAYEKGWLTKGNKMYRVYDNLLRVEASKLFALAYDLAETVEVIENDVSGVSLPSGSEDTSGVVSDSGVSSISGTPATTNTSGVTSTSGSSSGSSSGEDEELMKLLENLL